MVNRIKMGREERAKQFMPFDALKGLREAIKEKEKVIVPKVELTEYAQVILDQKLHQVKKNDMVTVVYFSQGEYVKVTGMVSRFDLSARVMKIVNTKISLDDIYDVKGEHITDDL